MFFFVNHKVAKDKNLNEKYRMKYWLETNRMKIIEDGSTVGLLRALDAGWVHLCAAYGTAEGSAPW